MSLVFLDNAKGFTRIAVVVSKKVEKSAVRRNKIRRRIYEVLRTNLEAIPKKKDYIFVVYSKDLYSLDYNELEKIVGKLVSESKI